MTIPWVTEEPLKSLVWPAFVVYHVLQLTSLTPGGVGALVSSRVRCWSGSRSTRSCWQGDR